MVVVEEKGTTRRTHPSFNHPPPPNKVEEQAVMMEARLGNQIGTTGDSELPWNVE